MLDKLLDFVIQFVELFYISRVVDAWEKGIILRFGKPVRDANPGLNWMFPFGVERLVAEDTFDKVASLPPQSLTTADGVSVIISAIVVYKVSNVRKVILMSGGHENAVIDAIPAVVAEHVVSVNWDDLNTEEFRQTIRTDANRRAAKWGVKVKDVRFANLARARSFRLFAEQNHT